MIMNYIKKSLCLLFVAMFFLANIFASDMELQQGNFILRLFEDSGTFSLFYLTENGKQAYFFSPYDDFSSTFFSVKVDEKIYKLNRDSPVEFSTYESETGAGIKYSVGKEIEVFADFSFVPEFDGVDSGCVKVELIVNNVSSESHTVVLKGVFDTILGENSGLHFSTSRFPQITTEQDLEMMMVDKWVRSFNDNYSVQFLLNGTDITVPQNVCVANKDLISSGVWQYVPKTGRSFNSVFSYNNSAVGVLWNPMIVTPNSKSSVCFYISFAKGSSVPTDSKFLGEAVPQSPLNEKDEVVYQDEYGTTYTLGTLSDEQLDPKYIEALLNRIRVLEADPTKVDRMEVLQLNAELDAILEKIRRM